MSEFVHVPTPHSTEALEQAVSDGAAKAKAKVAATSTPVKLGALATFMAALSGLLAAVWFVVTRRRRRRLTLPGHAVIVSPRKSTSIAHDGSVRSVQSAELTVSADDLERLWNPANLENLAGTYWRFLTKATLGIVRVHYDDRSRSVRLLGLVTLLRFDPPDYEFGSDYGRVSWQIRDGLLVARAGCSSGGVLTLDVRRLGQPAEPGRAKLRIEVEVSNFYPSIAAGLSTPVYEVTQSFIHVLVTHGFLRSLAALELVESKIGRLALPVAEPAE
jgi:hypothetical protein